MCSGYLPKPGLCSHPEELRVHLKGRINWNFLQIKHRFPQKQKSCKIWERQELLTLKQWKGEVTKKKICFKNSSFDSVASTELIIFILILFTNGFCIPWTLISLESPLMGSDPFGLLGTADIFSFFNKNGCCSLNSFCSVFEQIKGSSPYLTLDNY